MMSDDATRHKPQRPESLKRVTSFMISSMMMIGNDTCRARKTAHKTNELVNFCGYVSTHTLQTGWNCKYSVSTRFVDDRK